LRQAIFHHKATDKDWAVGALHIVDGQHLHKNWAVPGKSPSVRQVFKSDCIRRALTALLTFATHHDVPHIILAGDLNTSRPDVQCALALVQQNVPKSKMYVVGIRRNFIISTADVSKVTADLPTAWDKAHKAIVAEFGQAPSCCHAILIYCYINIVMLLPCVFKLCLQGFCNDSTCKCNYLYNVVFTCFVYHVCAMPLSCSCHNLAVAWCCYVLLIAFVIMLRLACAPGCHWHARAWR
jgi:hypothetical protein